MSVVFWIDCIPPKSTAQASHMIMKRKDGTMFVGTAAAEQLGFERDTAIAQLEQRNGRLSDKIGDANRAMAGRMT